MIVSKIIVKEKNLTLEAKGAKLSKAIVYENTYDLGNLGNICSNSYTKVYLFICILTLFINLV